LRTSIWRLALIVSLAIIVAGCYANIECDPSSANASQCEESKREMERIQQEAREALERETRNVIDQIVRAIATEIQRQATDIIGQVKQRVGEAIGDTVAKLPLIGKGKSEATSTNGLSNETLGKRLDVPYVPQIWRGNSWKYGRDGKLEEATTGLNNCGPASVAMAVQFYKGVSSTNLDAAARAIRGASAPGGGNSDIVGENSTTDFKSSSATQFLAKNGLKAIDVNGFDDLINHITQEHPVIILVDNSRYVRRDASGKEVPYDNKEAWTKEPHIVVVTGYDKSNIYINDPLAWTIPSGKNFDVPVESFKAAAEAEGWHASAIVRR